MLHVSLLGEQAITDDGAGVRTCSSRAVALVAFLAVHAGSPQTRQRIAGLFWPDSTDAQALTNLRRELHHLRQALGNQPALVVTSRDLCWHDSETCGVDVRTFDIERTAAFAAAAADDDESVLLHATRAIAQYRGDLLPGVYDDWLLEARSGLERQCVELCDLLCKTRARAGDLAGAADAARRRVQLQPMEEIGYRTLMQLQADLGDRAGAMSTYHHRASSRSVNLASPGPDDLASVPAPDGPRWPGRRAPAGHRRACRQPFRGSRCTACRPGTGTRPAARPVASRRGGPPQPGAGPRRRWRRQDPPGGRGRRDGAAPGRGSGEQPVLRHIRAAGTGAGGGLGAKSGSPGSDKDARPGLARGGRYWSRSGDRGERGTSARAIVDAWQLHRFFEGLARALLAVSHSPLLVLDNMQWCDQETLAIPQLCLGLDPGAQIMAAGTVRNDSPVEDPNSRTGPAGCGPPGCSPDFAQPVRGCRHSAPRRGDLRAAPPGGRHRPAAGHNGRLPALCHRQGIRSTVDASGRTPVPAGDLTGVLRNRLQQATAAAREVAGLAAAVGTDFTLDLLTEASDLQAGVVVGAVDELWRRRILHEFRDGYDFSHDLLRETAYAGVSPPKRWLLHRRIAQGLELLHADSADLVAAQLAEQYARGGRPARAIAYYQRAAGVAAVFAHAEAWLYREAAVAWRQRSAGERSGCRCHGAAGQGVSGDQRIQGRCGRAVRSSRHGHAFRTQAPAGRRVHPHRHGRAVGN
jgi:DNA-binding SARP family transcriptional activator